MSDSLNSLNHNAAEQPQASGPEQSGPAFDADIEAGLDAETTGDPASQPIMDNADLEADLDGAFDASMASENFDAAIEVVDVEILESQTQERSYEVHHDGALTYFQYFLDDEESTFGPGYGDLRNDAKTSPRSLVSASAVGVGALAAIFGAGLLVAEATNRSSISSQEGSKSITDRLQAEAEQNASEAAAAAKATNPENVAPDWSTTQKALAVSKGNAKGNSALGNAAVALARAKSPASSAVTAKLAPLSQAWGSSVVLPQTLTPPSNSPTIITSASLPTPAVAPANLAGLKPIKTNYQAVQPAATAVNLPDARVAPSPLPPPPIDNGYNMDDRFLQARMENLRDRMAQPIASGSVPMSSDGSDSLLRDPSGWNGGVPTPDNGTSIANAFDNGNLTASSSSAYGSAIATSPVANNTGIPRSIPTAPQAHSQTYSQPAAWAPTQTNSHDAVVAPVAGLLPTPVARPVAPEVSPMPSPRASVDPAQAEVQNLQARMIAPAARASQDINSLAELVGLTASHPLAISRDTARAALQNAEALSEFRVLPLTAGEYQRLWQESGNPATLAPSHGFVDYGHNIIAVVVNRGESSTATVSSLSASELKALASAMQARVPASTDPAIEVSAQQRQPVEALGQS